MTAQRFALIILATGTLSLWLLALPQGSGPAGAVPIQMKNVNYRLAENISLEVRSLRGDLLPTKAGEPVTFDDGSSFKVAVDQAEVAVSPASMTALMNSYVLAYPGSPIKNVSMAIEGNKIKQQGTMHKGVDLKFEIEGTLSVTDDGNIRMHADKIKSGPVPVKGLLHFLGEDLSKLVNQNAGRGMRIEGDDIILIPATLTPPPHLEGRVTRVAIQNGMIVQYFDSGKHLPALKPPLAAAGYIYHRGGVLRFGKLTMSDADLEIVGDRPGMFDFFQQEYQKQLVAGYSKSTAANGLVAHMFDYSHFRSKGRPGDTSPKTAEVSGSQPATGASR
jgi:hypothetical protein